MAASPPRRWSKPEGVLTGALDGVLQVAVGSFATWTLLHGAMLLGLALTTATVVWVVTVAGLIVLQVRRPVISRDALAPASPWLPAGLGVAAAGLAAVVSRPDADDAWYMIHSTWLAERGELGVRDVLFTDGAWPATYGAVPNLSSIESWFGMVARFTGLPAGDIAYRWFTPAAAFAAVWALWVLFRAWRARRPAASLMVAMAVVVLGGYAHTTFGNMHLARIWQGKAVLLAILVPCLYAVFAILVRDDHLTGRRLRGLSWAAAATGVAAVGASSTGIFLVPLIAAAAALPLLLRRDWRRLAPIVAAAVAPVVAGIVTTLSPVGARNQDVATYGSPWPVALGDGRVVAAACVVVVVLVLGVLRPHWWGTVDRRLQLPLLLVVGSGVLFTVEPLYSVFATLTGGEAIAHRLAWVVPFPALVGLVASLPARRLFAPVLPVAALVLALVVAAGTPLWAESNGAHVARPGSWKVRAPEDLVVARWVVDQEPEGRYLAANWVTFLVGTLSSEPRPVGTRLDYMATLEDVEGAGLEERLLLQGIADGADGRDPEVRDAAIQALDSLDVSVACVAWNDPFTDDVFGSSGFEAAYALGPWTCWRR